MSNQMNQYNPNNLNMFMNSKRVVSGDTDTLKTHTSMGGMLGTFSITGSDYEKFVQLYKQAVENNENLHIVERNPETGPLVADIDFRFDKKCAKRMYSEKHIEKLVKKYFDTITKYLEIDEYRLTAYVTEKDKPTKEEKKDGTIEYKDGFHLYFPDIPLTVNQRYFFYDCIKKDLENDNFFSDLPTINTLDDIFDISVIINNGLLMHGSHKKGRTPYDLTRIYNKNLVSLDANDFLESDKIDATLLRCYTDGDEINFINKEYEENAIRIGERYRGGKKKAIQTMKNTNIIKDMKMTFNKNTDNINLTFNKNTDNLNKYDDPMYSTIPQSAEMYSRPKQHLENIKIARQLVGILSLKRASSYNDWIRVGWALHNIDPCLLIDFIEFSKKDPRKYEPGCCEKVWLESKNQGYTIATLYWWAKQDNIEEYTKILLLNINELVMKAKSGTHDDLANVIYEMYKHQYKCVSLKKKSWYEFQGHKWVGIEEGYTLSEKISSEVSQEFLKMNTIYTAKAAETKGDTDELIKMGRRLIDIFQKLKDIRFKESVMKACSYKFYDKKFVEKLDNNIYLLGFNNGVYDFKTRCFRDGMPDDNISLSVGYDYKTYTMSAPIVQDICRYFETIQQTQEMRDYLLKLISTYLIGSAKDQKFIIWTGSGSNGKSLTVELIKHALGEYYGTMSSAVITQKKKGASNASPEMANKVGKRFVVIQEPEHNDTVYVGQMKELTGCDTIEARALFCDPFMFKPQFKLVLTCNRLPIIPSTDQGTWRRVRVTNFGSEFVDGKPKTKYQFKKDNTLAEKFEEWKQPFIWYLINIIYPKYESEGLIEPAEVTAHTLKYKKDSDVYLEFILENTQPCDENECEQIAALYDTFKTWYRSGYTSSLPSKKDFINYMVSKDYKVEKALIYGLKIVTPGTTNDDDDDEENNKKEKKRANIFKEEKKKNTTESEESDKKQKKKVIDTEESEQSHKPKRKTRV